MAGLEVNPGALETVIRMSFALLFAAGLLLALGSTFARLTFRFIYEDGNHEMSLETRALFGLLRIRHEIPALQLRWTATRPQVEMQAEIEVPGGGSAGEGAGAPAERPSLRDRITYEFENLASRFQALREFYRSQRCWLDYLGDRTVLEEFKWHSDLGLGDAAETGWAVGALWTLKGTFLGWFYNKIEFGVPPDLLIEPQFEGRKVRTAFSCIFRFRLAHIIFAGLIFAREYLRKGARTFWRNIPSRV